MKRNFTVCAILAVAMILTPLVSMKQVGSGAQEEPVVFTETNGYISVMKTENGNIEKLGEREYLLGALAAEMDMTYHDEALKAQVIACYTYVLYTKENNSDNLGGADISDSPQVHQGYLDAEQRRKKWGENFEKYEKKAGEIVDAVASQAIYYEDKPILSVYHNLNSGRTKSASEVWKKDYPYLVSTESAGDRLSTVYSTDAEFTYDEFKEKIEQIDGVKLDSKREDWIGKTVKDEDGYVRSVELCGYEVSSADFRTALELKSCCFTVRAKEENIEITTVGDGHFVGMSQYGADYMARQGADYREILTHYYKGTKIL